MTKQKFYQLSPKLASGILSGLRVGVGTDEVSAAEHVRNIDIYLDEHHYMTVQVSHTISTCSLNLRNIGWIHILTSHLDYCNSVVLDFCQ